MLHYRYVGYHDWVRPTWSASLMGITNRGCYRYMDDLLHLEACTPTRQQVCWPRGPSPVEPNCLSRLLQNHPNRQFASYVVCGFSDGFHIGFAYNNARLRSRNENRQSSLANPEVITNHITAELEKGRLVGPVVESLMAAIQVNPIGLVPKGHRTRRWRVIVHLSAPNHFVVNDDISEELSSFSYTSLDDVVDLIRRLGTGTQLVKMDLKDAYRIVPIHPDDNHLLGISWNGAIYVDRALPFGLRTAPKIFTAVANALAWALHSRGVRFVLHYLDEFLIIEAPNSPKAMQAAHYTTATFAELGVPVASHKTEGPSTCVTFLGILIDTVAGQLRFTARKAAAHSGPSTLLVAGSSPQTQGA